MVQVDDSQELKLGSFGIWCDPKFELFAKQSDKDRTLLAGNCDPGKIAKQPDQVCTSRMLDAFF
jgi:hypothetical protein